jgi:hypothetical protein
MDIKSLPRGRWTILDEALCDAPSDEAKRAGQGVSKHCLDAIPIFKFFWQAYVRKKARLSQLECLSHAPTPRF